MQRRIAMRALSPDADGRARAAFNPELAVKRAERDGRLAALTAGGWSREDAEAAIRNRVERRRRKLAPRRAGRPPRLDENPLHVRWLERRDSKLEELWHGYRERLLEDRPTVAMALRDAALDEWAEHPETWPRETYRPSRKWPDELAPEYLPQMVTRMLGGIKLLEKRRKRMNAA
jgi:hypothetical protein